MTRHHPIHKPAASANARAKTPSGVRHLIATVALGAIFTTLTFARAQAEVIGKVDVDWLGNDIIVEAFEDPKVKGVTCHVTYFERGLIDRLQNGNWFEDPSNSAISCQQTGPITLGDIDRSDEGESVFSERRSIIWKSLQVKRIFDETHQTLVYVVHGQQVQNGSAKMAISTVPLFQP
jgi:CreA protein